MGHTTRSGDEPAEPPATWHLCWQAAVGRDFCADPLLRDRIRRRLLDTHRQAGRVLITYALLPTEIHVIAQLEPDDSARSVARAIGTIVARWARDAQPLCSPVLAGRYKAHRIGSVGELLEEVRLQAWRPVWLGLCKTPSHWPHGAARIALGLTPANGFDARPLLQHFGQTVPQARECLRAWIARRPDDQQCRIWELMNGLSLAAGTVGPQQAMARVVHGAAAAALVAAGGADGIDGALHLLDAWVMARFGLAGAADLRQASGRSGARCRALVASLAVEHGLCSAASVARHFGRAKTTLSEQMICCRSDPVVRQMVAIPVQRLIEEAKALQGIERSPSGVRISSRTPGTAASGATLFAGWPMPGRLA